MLVPLSFPPTSLELEKHQTQIKIKCLVRKKWLVLTPEEWVRQHVIGFLNSNYQIPFSLMSVEKSFNYNGLTKRWDIVVFDREGSPIQLIECKRPEVKLDNETLHQVSSYQKIIQSKRVTVTNGIQCFVLHENSWKEGLEFLA